LALRSGLSTRRDLLIEILALRHQLSVLARSNRGFRTSDHLLWLLRRVWPRWRDALLIVQPATVDRWHRGGFPRWWRRQPRRPGRPRIDARCRGLIRRMAAENPFWGAPRIHGELLKLGFAVCERTVSRYLPHPRRAPSQSWRTFLTNHLGQLPIVSSALSAYAPEADDVVDLPSVPVGRMPLVCEGLSTSHPGVLVDSFPRASRMPLVRDHRLNRTARRRIGGRDPPTKRRLPSIHRVSWEGRWVLLRQVSCTERLRKDHSFPRLESQQD
jgi:hypothetical protein